LTTLTLWKESFWSNFWQVEYARSLQAMLLSLRQHDDESLKDFIMRFNQAKLSVESPTDQMVYASLYQVIRADGPLMVELARRQPDTLLEFMNKVEEFINQDYNAPQHVDS
jgi:chlorite dismutase